MTALDQTAPLSAEQRDELIKLHEYDELIFGGFICLHCTPDDCDDPDDNVYWPCPPLHEAGVTDHEAVAIIKAHRAGIEQKAAVQRVRELLAEVDRLNAELGWLRDVVNGVGGLSSGLPDPQEVARLRQAVNAHQATLDRVATVPGAFQERLGVEVVEEFVRRSDLNQALGLTPDGRGVS